MADVWMVATGQDHEGLNSVKLMFDNELAARQMADKIDEVRSLHDLSIDMAKQGWISWDDVFPEPGGAVTMDLPDGTRFFVGQWTHVESFPLRSE